MKKEIIELGKLIYKDIDRYISSFKIQQDERIFFIKMFTQRNILSEEKIKEYDLKFFNEIDNNFLSKYSLLRNGEYLLVNIQGGIGFKNEILELIKTDCTGDFNDIIII